MVKQKEKFQKPEFGQTHFGQFVNNKYLMREYEVFEKMGTKTITCTCGKQANKVPSLSNFHLKGGGWAKDNYGNKK